MGSGRGGSLLDGSDLTRREAEVRQSGCSRVILEQSGRL